MTKEKKKKIGNILLILLLVSLAIGLVGLVVGVMFLVSESDKKHEAGQTFIIIGIVAIFVGIILTPFAMGPFFHEHFKTLTNKDANNISWLRIYASKNIKYVYKYHSGGRNYNPERYAEAYLGSNYKFNDVIEFDEDKVKELFKCDYIINDGRKVGDTECFEIFLNTKKAYVFIQMSSKKYYIIILNSDELRRRDEINNTKYKAFANYKIMEGLTPIFDEAKEDKREIIKQFDSNYKFMDVVNEIIELLDEYND